MKWFSEINDMYSLLNKMVIVCLRKGLKLVIENPATPPHILTLLWLPCTFKDNDRTQNGDFYKKPTQYWFFNLKPYNNLVFELYDHVETRIINKVRGKDKQIQRSMIHPQYAERFIKKYLIPYETKIGDEE